MSRDLAKLIRQASERRQCVDEAIAAAVEKREHELADLREELIPGNGFTVARLLAMTPREFASEVDASEYELFDMLAPLVMPRCLVWLPRFSARSLVADSKRDGDQSTIISDIDRLTKLRDEIDKAVTGLRKLVKS